MRIVFMGTPQFAVPSLKALIEAGHEVCGVFSQPDKPVGRHQNKLKPTPVKECALSYQAAGRDIPVYQPEKLRDGTALAGSCRMTFWPCLPRGASTSTPHCCPSTGGRPLSTGPSSTGRRRPA